jgi:hypothetical protein
MLTRLLSIACVAAAGGIAINCTSFDPDLGGVPYFCANDKCPDGYVCTMVMGEMPPKDKQCVKAGGMPIDAGSGSGFQCAMDGSLEPNDTPMTAFQTDVPSAPLMQRTFGPISVCPEGDKDHFAVTVTSGMPSLAVRSTWDSGMPIQVSVLSQAGTPIANGMMAGPQEFRACAANLPPATYYASAFAAGIKNNYRIKIKLCPSCVFGTNPGECNMNEQ